MTTTEIIMNLAVWALLFCGLFFGLRARFRKRGKAPTAPHGRPTVHHGKVQKP